MKYTQSTIFGRARIVISFIIISTAIIFCSCDHDDYPNYLVHTYNGKKHLYKQGGSWSLPCDKATTDWEKRLCDKEFKGRNWKIRADTCRIKNEESGATNYFPCFSYKYCNSKWNNPSPCGKAAVKHEVDACGEAEKEKEKKE